MPPSSYKLCECVSVHALSSKCPQDSFSEPYTSWQPPKIIKYLQGPLKTVFRALHQEPPKIIKYILAPLKTVSLAPGLAGSERRHLLPHAPATSRSCPPTGPIVCSTAPPGALLAPECGLPEAEAPRSPIQRTCDSAPRPPGDPATPAPQPCWSLLHNSGPTCSSAVGHSTVSISFIINIINDNIISLSYFRQKFEVSFSEA